jgi:hypothetical protein
MKLPIVSVKYAPALVLAEIPRAARRLRLAVIMIVYWFVGKVRVEVTLVDQPINEASSMAAKPTRRTMVI